MDVGGVAAAADQGGDGPSLLHVLLILAVAALAWRLWAKRRLPHVPNATPLGAEADLVNHIRRATVVQKMQQQYDEEKQRAAPHQLDKASAA
jgi:hypothetical protein